MPKNIIILGDNLAVLKKIKSGSINLSYCDPPFNSKKVQKRKRIKNGERVDALSELQFNDCFESLSEFLFPRVKQIYRTLAADGSFFLHLDYREVHNVKVNVLDKIFGEENFMNEIIWAYDYGARSKTRWSAKHDNILWYAKDCKSYTFNYDEMERIPYMAPGLVGKEKAARGKTPTDCFDNIVGSYWWHTIVPTNGKEKTGYPTQKPLGLLRRIISVHTKPTDCVLDAFAGSGTTGEAAALLGRRFILIDSNKQAADICKARLSDYSPRLIKI
jgi:site-specific DNA-methyltransferase (adenine-specific)